ncbi:MAG TPA: RdgB/HAM1 family non-canonical purine NTP pyrophosphatase [Bacteroidales bacterium]|nr:RdgB/HAM1 family non-canonical purine NTP pyrophosphatase [Bacteroidales bacterium]HNS47383.1 RdgB/HAM1 family non-canonical purine NTP pyrophosphatase [Bacteroidales bacterium]
MKMTELVFVTHNPHKLYEIRSLFDSSRAFLPGLDRYRLVSLQDIGYLEDIPETMDTLEGNASVKARTIHTLYGCTCFADDTGLEVEALGNQPGALSARYAGEDKNFGRNIEKVLQDLQTATNRKARFRTVISLMIGQQEILFEGIVQGKIIDTGRGQEGFGYDPVFVPEGYDQTFAEMNLEQKNRISHRYRAFRKMMDYLNASSIAIV